jgi:TonB family protein
MKRSEIFAYTGTTAFTLIVLLILLLVTMPGMNVLPEDDGVMISFGESADGGGIAPTASQNVVSASVPVPSEEDKLLTQTDPSVSMTESKKTSDTSKPTKTDTREQQRREQEALQKANDLIGGSFGSSQSSGSGRSSSDQTAGNPVGSGTSGGNSWSLNGRNLMGSMPTPKYEENDQGTITVEIRVDASGTVVGAKVTRYTIATRSLHQASVKAALQTRFSSGEGIAVGTITYKFNLR